MCMIIDVFELIEVHYYLSISEEVMFSKNLMMLSNILKHNFFSKLFVIIVC